MKEFEVYVHRIEKYFVVVKAETEDEAERMADEMVIGTPEQYHDDSEVEFRVYEVRRIKL